MYICEPYALSSKNTNEYELKSRLCQLLYKRYDGRVWFVYVPLASYVTNYYVAMKFAGHCCPPQLFFPAGHHKISTTLHFQLHRRVIKDGREYTTYTPAHEFRS